MLRLVTIPISHYCEKARWSLDLAGQRYREDANLPLFHLVPTRRAGGHRTVPVLVTPEGSLRESSDILRWADARLPAERRLLPDAERTEIERWLDELDNELGVDTRLWSYAQLLPHRALVVRFGTAGAPRWQGRAAAMSYPVLRALMTRKLGISDAAVARAEQRIERLLDRVDVCLADGRPHLTGDRFTAADLTFAALGAPLVSPREYHVPLPSPDDAPASTAARMRAWRERPAGRYILEMFRLHRRAPAAGTGAIST